MIHRILYHLTKALLRCLQALSPKVSLEHQVRAIVRGGSLLGLQKGQFRLLPPCPNTYGPIRFSGNTLPVVEYTVFDETLMDFVQVRAEFALPDQVRITPTLLVSADYQYQKTEVPDGTLIQHDDVGNPIFPRLPTETPLKSEYGKPAYFLLNSFYHYFPLTEEGPSHTHDDRKLRVATPTESPRTPNGRRENEVTHSDPGTKPGLRTASPFPH